MTLKSRPQLLREDLGSRGLIIGLFSKKSRTTTETFSTTIIEHKILKLTYLQTLAITGGAGDLKEIAGETEGFSEENVDLSRTDDERVKNLAKFFGANGAIVGGGDIGIGKLINDGFNSAFGKSISSSVTASVEDKGWRVVKTWLQPEFDKIRYALGIRELTLAQFRYEKVSEVISTPWVSPKDIVKVSLIVDQFIPPQFPPGQDYLQFYVKPELADVDWIRVNPIDHRTVYDSKGNIVPRIINFNTERPATARLEDAFITTKEEVKQVRFRAVLNRPAFVEGTTTPADGFSPILKSYRMLLHPRGGL